MATIWQKHKEIIILAVLAVVFFLIYAWFPLITKTSPLRFNSPDETGNHFWIKNFAQGKGLQLIEPLNGVGNGLIHIRGMNSVRGAIVPGSFLGIIFLYGTLARLSSLDLVPLFTPFFAVLAVISFFFIISRIFSKKIGFVSAMILFIHPLWWYFSARSMFHNVLFVSLLLYSFALLFWAIDKGKAETSWKRWRTLALYLCSGLLVGLALTVRTSELVWVSFIVITIFFFSVKKIKWSGVILFFVGTMGAMLPVFATNIVLYGSPLSIGYQTVMKNGIGSILNQPGVLFRLFISPFGFNSQSIIVNGSWYLINLIWPLTLASLFGLVIWLNQTKKRHQIVYFCLTVIVSVYLLIFYGSWQFVDRIDMNSFSIGTSFGRYWLPIYIFLIPFSGLLVSELGKLFSTAYNNFSRNVNHQQESDPTIKGNFFSGLVEASVIIGIILVLFCWSLNLVVFKTDESLWYWKVGITRNVYEARAIIKSTESNAIIVSYRQADKILFPERKVIPELAVTADYSALYNLTAAVPLYYLTYAPPATVSYISQRDFIPKGLEIVQGNKIFYRDWLYLIRRTAPIQ